MTRRTAPVTAIPSYGVKSEVWWSASAVIVRRAAGSNSTRSASRPASTAPFRGRPNSRAGVVASASTTRSDVSRPPATAVPQTTDSSVSTPGAPLETSGNGRPSTTFSTASRSGTWSVATRSSAPDARPAHSASWSAGSRKGGEMIARTASASGSAYRPESSAR